MIPFSPYPGVQGAFQGRVPAETPFAWRDLLELKQVHGDRIWTIRSKHEAEQARGREGDAWISNLPGLPLGIRTADCIPILIAHPSGVVAAVHAGWRGTAAGIAPKVLAELESSFQVDPLECHIAMGPSICQACFEVGPEVAEQFRSFPLALQAKAEKHLLDLRKVNLEQMLALGIRADRIAICEACTRCRETDFYSHRGAVSRGNKSEGRNYSWILRLL